MPRPIMKLLAIYNFGMFRRPTDDPVNEGFHRRNDLNFLIAERSDGFVARSGYDGEPGPESWGKQVYPRFYDDRGDGWAPSTLSLWQDLPSLMAFTYAGIHREAMRHAPDWFVERSWPGYVLFWVEAAQRPIWADGVVARLEMLHEKESGPEAFDFKFPYDAGGNRTTVNNEEVRCKMDLNMAVRSRLDLE
ncbi:DUF3291 domain-containing protein [Mesorhizobium sp. SP-1A]|uniref:DUF3291 domain-containing protein n=1 Tax=Mesorhizobium sp. SP-1A TaxID=3077840 RepID=UPI0028F6C2BF|nr:DUF3291 domain-containing protein [Mesorhizobium sp. SP-1A]